MLTRYVLERLLYRLTLSPYARRFVLKGAMLATTWFPAPNRQTRARQEKLLAANEAILSQVDAERREMNAECCAYIDLPRNP